MRRHLRRVAPVLGCLLAGSLLLFLAVSATRWQDALASGDSRYRSAPDGRLWDPGRLAVGSISKLALGIDDDLAFRHAVQSFRLSHPEQPANSNPALVVYRNEATVELTDIERHAKDPEWRSTAANLLGVLSYSDAVYDYVHRTRLLANAAQRFQQAIAFEPDNEDAKFNLELTLGLSRGMRLAENGGGANPAPGGKGSKGAGAGDPGSGY
jgi:hypothetical protein